MRRWASIFLALGLVIAIGSCKRADETATTPGATPAASPDQSAQFKDLDEKLKANGATLESLLDEFKQTKLLKEAQGPTLEKDIQVSRLLLYGAQTAAQAKSQADTSASLQRLERVLNAVMAELPAAEMQLDLERALYALKQETGADAITHASGALLLAVNVGTKATLPTLVPTVVKDIEAAKAKVDKKDTPGAQKAIGELVTKVSGHASIKCVSNALAGVRGAQEALLRQAWPVVLAELQQVDALFGELVQVSQPAATAAAPAAEQPAAPVAGTDAAPTAPEGAAAPPAAPEAPTPAPPAATAAPGTPAADATKAPPGKKK